MPAIMIRSGDPIDLQMHTIYSDGRWTPEQLFDYLAGAGFRAVAVTDHDNVDSITRMVQAGAARGVHVIPAVEVTTEWDGRMADLLCFGGDFQGSVLEGLVRATVARQRENVREVYDELRRRGYTFPRQAEVLREEGGEPVRQYDNIRLLLQHGHAPSIPAALETVREAGHREVGCDLAAAVAAAHETGGVAMIAHPGRREPGFTLYDPALLDEVSADRIPLDGIEVRHPTHTAEQVEEYERYVRAHGWLQSAGSDSHGPDHRLPIPYPAAVARDLLARCGVEVVE